MNRFTLSGGLKIIGFLGHYRTINIMAVGLVRVFTKAQSQKFSIQEYSIFQEN